MSKRKCEDWLRTYLLYADGQESPDTFHLWCGVSAISAALERNVLLDRGFYTLFPNMYIVLVSGSAVARKSTAIGMVSKIFKISIPDGNILSQKTTPEALIKALHECYSKRKISAGYLIADEMSVFLGDGSRDSSLIQLLTKLYDGSDFDYHTLSRGKEVCTNPNANMLAGSAPEWLKSSLPAHAIGGGFTGRIVFVHHKGSGRRVAFPYLSSEARKLKSDLIEDLIHIRTLKGEFKLTKEAHDYFEDWYVDVYEPDNVELTLKPYYARKPDTLLKVAMVVSITRRDDLTLQEDDMAIAMDMLGQNEKFLPEMMRIIQSNEISQQEQKVLNVIKRREKVSYSDLLRQVSYFANSKMVGEILESLIASELLKEEIHNGVRSYRCTGKG